jgi:serine protease Do
MRPTFRPLAAALLGSALALSPLAALAAPAIPAATAAPAVAPAVAPLREPGDSFADLAAKLLPGVVNISSSQIIQGPGRGPDIPLFPPGSPFEQFFKDFMDRQRRANPHGDTPQPQRRAQSLGSGFIIDPSGIVVTNNHVIDGADEITVILQDNTSLKATVVGRDDRTDIAVLKVNSDKPLPYVSFGDSDTARVGDWVLAIGNPFGLGGTVTAGIVSARGRNINEGPYDNFIQTDAAINKGNSGGPLFNLQGQVVGMNTAIYSPSGGSIGIGFSIPSNMVKEVVAQLRDFGHARRGWLGVRIQQVSPDIADSVGLKEASGAMVAGVSEGGPAEQGKIKSGDVILTFDGKPVKEMRNLPLMVAQTPIGKEVPVTVWRDGKAVTLSVKVGELPDDQKQATAEKKSEPGKPVELDGLGIKPGDVITEVAQGAVKSPAEVIDRVEKARKANRKSVLLLVQSGDSPRFVPLPVTPPADKKPG